MKKHLLFRSVWQLIILSFTITTLSFAQGTPGAQNVEAPAISSGKHFVHIATTSNSTSNWTTIDNSNTNANPTAKLFITHNWDASGGGVYNDHVSGLWYDGSKWTIFNEDPGAVPIIENSAYHILVADESQATVFQHTATPSNINLNWTVLSHPEIDGNPNARILVTQILISTAGNIYNNREVGVWYDGSNWAIFNQNLDAMPDGASFNVLVLSEDNSILHTAVSGNIQGSTTKIDHPALNNNPNAIIYVNQNWNGGSTSGVYNTQKVSTYYYSGKWSIYTEDNAGMIENSKYNVYFGSPSFVHKSTLDNISLDLTLFDNPLVNRDPNALVFTLHNWNPYGSGTVVYDIKLGVYYTGSIWGVYTEDASTMPENIYYNLAIAPKTDSAFLHTTTAANISGGNFTTIDNPLLNGNPNARLLIQHVYMGTRQNTNLGVWYNGSKWTIFTEDISVMPAGKSFNVWLLNNNKSFVQEVTVANNTIPYYSYIDNPLTNNNPDANILVTPLLNGGDYFDHVQGVWYDAPAQKWVLYNEDLSDYTLGLEYNVYVANASGSITSVENENPLVVNSFNLEQNYPNPFNPTTKIRFALVEQSQVTLKVYNILGKEIATLVNDVKGVGVHEVSFDGSGLASGVYFYTLQTGQFNQTRKMILMK